MEEAPWSDTSRSSVSSCGLARLYMTFIPEIPSFWNRVAFLNKVTFRMWTVTACAIHRPHFKRSLQNMAPGASFEYGQRFTVNIWPLKPQMVFSSLILLFHMHVCLKDVNWRWQMLFGLFLFIFFFFTRELAVKFKTWFLTFSFQSKKGSKSRLSHLIAIHLVRVASVILKER